MAYKILKFSASNIKRLKVIEITPTGAVVQIVGNNGQGKTSVLDAIVYALTGTSNIPNEPIRKGQEKAFVTLDLGEIIVTRKFTANGTTLVVEQANGARFPSPQAILDKLCGALTFDPLAFTRLSPKEQLDTLKSLVTLDVNLDEIDRLNKQDFDKRTEYTREHKALSAQAAGLSYADDTPDTEIDVSQLATELDEAGQRNTAVERGEGHRNSLQVEATQTLKHAASCTLEAKKIREVEIESLKEKIRHLEQTASNYDHEASTHNTRAQELKEQLESVAVLERVNTEAIREKINGAKKINEAVFAKKRKVELLALAEEKKKLADRHSQLITDRTKTKTDAIANAVMPVDGMTFGDGEIKFRGVPFNQASSAEQLMVSTIIATFKNPKLRIIRIQDGSLLDKKHMEILTQLAEKRDMQIWIERIESDDPFAVHIEDGSVVVAEGDLVSAQKESV